MGSYEYFYYAEAHALVGAAQSVWAGDDIRITIQMPISDFLSKGLSEYFEDRVESVFITDSDIRHIRKHHSSGEVSRGQVDIRPEDFALLPRALNDYDNLQLTDTDKQGNKKFLITKELEGTVYIATVQRGRRKMAIRSFWKKKVSGASC